MGQEAEVLKDETQKSLKELQENTNKKKKLRNNIQDIKTEETTKNHKGRQIWKELRSHRCKHQDENTRDRRENLMC